MRHLRFLRYVDQVARSGSIRKAADTLNVTASALNRRIMDMEDELGTQLFERRPRGGKIPARVSPGEFIAGGKVDAAAGVQILQKTFQSLFEADLGNHACNGNTASSGISEFGHG